MESSHAKDKKPLKVLYISPNGFLGGAEKVVFNLIKSHNKNKFISSILFLNEGEFSSECKRLGINTICIKSSFRLSRPLGLIKALLEIRKIIKEVSPDIIHSTMAYSHLVISLASLGIRLKKVWFQHGPVGKILDRLASFFAVDLLLFNSTYLQKLHHKTFPKVRIISSEAVIKLGVEKSNSHKEILKKPIINLGMAGRITPIKCYEIAFEAIKNILNIPDHKKFILKIAGAPKTNEDKKYQDFLNGLLRKLELESSVEFLGHQQSMDTFYSEIDIFIHTSPYPEPFGLVLAEAMEKGCLALAPSGGGSADFLIDGKTGINLHYEKSKFSDELTKKLELFLASHSPVDQTYWNGISRNGQEMIRQDFSLEQMIENVESLYLKL